MIKKPLVDAQIFDPAQLGQIGSALFFSYAIGKLVNLSFPTDDAVKKSVYLALREATKK